jgi:hypothetical protein
MDGPSASFRAPWGASVKVLSICAAVFLLGMSAFQSSVLPRDLLGGWPWLLATGMPLLIVVACALFVVRGYAIDGSTLRVRRLLWSSIVPLDSLRGAWSSPDAMRGSLRLFGNGGLFSISGLFRNRDLGSYRAFAMDPRLAVVLDFPDRKVVITPETPERFLAQLRVARPWVTIGAPAA